MFTVYWKYGRIYSNKNAMNIEDTGEWPYVSAREKDYTHSLFEW